MKQIIQIHLGQSGSQIGNECWKLYCLEHDINFTNGMVWQDLCQEQNGHSSSSSSSSSSIFFQQSASNSKYTPRSIFFDHDPTVVDQIKKSTNLYSPANMISGKECLGVYSFGSWYNMQTQLKQRIRKLSQKCDNLQGFLFYHSLGGGTGSTTSGQLLQHASIFYQKKAKICYTLFPSPDISNSIIEPYNSVLALSQLSTYSDASVAFDNQSLYEILEKKLGIQQPLYQNLNGLLSQVFVSQRQQQYQLTNLIPYQWLNLLITSYAPFISRQNAFQQVCSTNLITEQCFNRNNFILKQSDDDDDDDDDYQKDKLYACNLMYNGDISHREVVQAIDLLAWKSKKKKKKKEDFMQNLRVKIEHYNRLCRYFGYQAHEQMIPPKSVCMVANSTTIRQTLKRIKHKFCQMFKKRAFVHKFACQGTGEEFFHESLQDISSLIKDYQQFMCVES